MQSLVILDNSYTPYTMDTIRVGWEQNLTSVRKAINEVDNQILTRDTKGLSEAQMSEYRKCFNHFDRNRSRKLELSDFKACLVSLGFRLMNNSKVTLIRKLGTPFVIVSLRMTRIFGKYPTWSTPIILAM